MATHAGRTQTPAIWTGRGGSNHMNKSKSRVRPMEISMDLASDVFGVCSLGSSFLSFVSVCVREREKVLARVCVWEVTGIVPARLLWL